MLKLFKVASVALLGLAVAEESAEVQAEAPEEVQDDKRGPRCEGYKTFDVMGDGFINKSEWKAFTEKHPLFVLAVADSSNDKSCESEKLLAPLHEKLSSKEWAYPVKDAKKK